MQNSVSNYFMPCPWPIHQHFYSHNYTVLSFLQIIKIHPNFFSSLSHFEDSIDSYDKIRNLMRTINSDKPGAKLKIPLPNNCLLDHHFLSLKLL